jgi:hypothetical protein
MYVELMILRMRGPFRGRCDPARGRVHPCYERQAAKSTPRATAGDELGRTCSPPAKSASGPALLSGPLRTIERLCVTFHVRSPRQWRPRPLLLLCPRHSACFGGKSAGLQPPCGRAPHLPGPRLSHLTGWRIRNITSLTVKPVPRRCQRTPGKATLSYFQRAISPREADHARPGPVTRTAGRSLRTRSVVPTCAGRVTSDTAAPPPRRRPWVPIPCRGTSAPGALRGV